MYGVLNPSLSAESLGNQAYQICFAVTIFLAKLIEFPPTEGNDVNVGGTIYS